MAKANRKTLKGYFSTGRMPTGEHFGDLVDSVLNIVDDGLNKTENGLQLSPKEGLSSVMEFFGHILDEKPLWRFEVDHQSRKLRIRRGDADDGALFVLNPDGRVEIEGDLCVTGRVEARGFAGLYAKGECPADGKWHDLTGDLTGACMFRVVVGCGRFGFGKYAVMEATVAHCFGRHRHIRTQASWYGMIFNRLALRWVKNGQSARLQVRTRCNYGGETMIHFEITELWHG